MKLFVVCFLGAALLGCSTNTKSRLAVSSLGFAVGAAVGAATTPKDERTEMHALYWGGLLGLISAVTANYYFNDEHDISALQLENAKLKKELDIFQNGATKELLTTRLRQQESVSGKTEKVSIKIYKVDKWIDQDERTKIHADKIMEIQPLP